MKIGYLLQAEEEIRRPPFNGPANHIRQVVCELKQLGHTVKLLARLDGKLWVTEDLKQFTLVRVAATEGGAFRLVERFIRRAQSELRLPYLALFESVRFALACRQELIGSDVFLERASWMGYGGALASRFLRVPLVLEYNGDPTADLKAKGIAPQGLQSRLSERIMKLNLKSASHVVASGEGWRVNCIEKWGTLPARTTTIENGTDLLKFLNRERLRSFRSEAELEGPLTLVYLGGFYPWQGVSILLCALRQVLNRGVNARLILIGSGSGELEASQLTADLNLSDNVVFTGRLSVEEYGSHLADADIGVSPYCGWAEFSGLKLFDYKAAGLPTIASGVNGHPVTLQHGQTGWIIQPCEEDSLVEAILKLSADSKLRVQMGRNARIEAESLHSWTHTARRLEQIFAKVAVS
jgi:glycosyltransferase involved in cell wall biosynthesis